MSHFPICASGQAGACHGPRRVPHIARSTMQAVIARLILLAAILAAGAGSSLAAADTPLQVVQAWARATPPAATTGAAYLTIVNRGAATDRLVGVSSPAAAGADIHIGPLDGTGLRGRPGSPRVVPPGGPGGFNA